MSSEYSDEITYLMAAKEWLDATLTAMEGDHARD